MPLQAIYRYELKRGLAVNPTTGLSLPPPGAERERAATPAEAEACLRRSQKIARYGQPGSTPPCAGARFARCASPTSTSLTAAP